MEEKEYSLYFLYDPRTNILCYVGITKQMFKDRLLQHKNPVPSNQAPIAKLQRYLKNNNLTLYGEVMLSGDKEEIEREQKKL